jgi:hypothetical protein
VQEVVRNGWWDLLDFGGYYLALQPFLSLCPAIAAPLLAPAAAVARRRRRCPLPRNRTMMLPTV